MSNMKDYMMWLDDNNVAKWDMTIGELIIPDGVDIYSPELVEQYQNDTPWHGGDFIIDEDEDDQELYDEDDLGDACEWTPTSYWFTEQNGLTGEALNFLHKLDSQGELV